MWHSATKNKVGLSPTGTLANGLGYKPTPSPQPCRPGAETSYNNLMIPPISRNWQFALKLLAFSYWLLACSFRERVRIRFCSSQPGETTKISCE